MASPGDTSDALPADSERIPSVPIEHPSTPAIAGAAFVDGVTTHEQRDAPDRERPAQPVAGEPREIDRAPREAERVVQSASALEAQPFASAARVEAAAEVRQSNARHAHAMVDLPKISSTLPADSGLEIVETRFRPAPEPEPEPVQVGPRRVRPPRVTITDEPLQIVETRKSDQPPAG